jgi:isocitrate/isopropylmalate dehydrogenase
MAEEPIQKPEDIVKQTYGEKVIGHDKDLANIRERLDQCYVKGDKEFMKDVEEVVSTILQKDDSRRRIKEYAKEAFTEAWREKEKEKSDTSWKWRNILIPALIALVAAIIGAGLLPIFEKIFNGGK